MTGVNDIRSAFQDYFAKNGHEIVPSGPLVPRNDPTLLFTNAGMVQFKNVFTGQEKRPYDRAVTAQKCVRAGGKHNDLDNVGYTARHHTFFEMLGNFSFGDYFKDRAIELAWNLVTKEFGLPKEKLLVTVYAEDDEAFRLWKTIAGLPDEKIVRIATSDNFWQMGDTGPCGPCSEIFYDHGAHIPGGPPGSPDEDGDRFIEIWNLVFMQFEQFEGGERVELPRPSIDTGMGLERISAVLQGTHDNYETDLMRRLIAASVERTGVPAEGAQKPSHRVIADHLRASAFLIADGVLPSNEGRGYVLRRIMRRAMRHAELLGVREPLMHKLVPTLVGEMGEAYPELVRAQPLVTETLELEETRFRTTLARGIMLLNEETEGMREGDTLSGETAFKLYDTFGFPLDLTQDALRARGIGVDMETFNAAMERQRAEARKAWAGSGEAVTERVWFGIRERAGATEFLGYETEEADAVVHALVHEGEEASRLAKGQEGVLVLNQTPFYGESGGQQGDRGVIVGQNGRFIVTDTHKKLGDLWVHYGMVEEGEIAVGEAVHLQVDHVRRSGLRSHHSATHLIHAALRDVLGEHVAQKGSLVAPDRLRFDFSHPKSLSDEELKRIEELANRAIVTNSEVTTRVMPVEDAVQSGAMALFGEKYGDEVRVVGMGAPGEGANKPWSLELCGGTHVSRTGDLGLVVVVNEGAVGAGTRRVEALAGDAARRHLVRQNERLNTIAAELKVAPDEIEGRLSALIEERRRLERELAETKRRLALGETGGGSAEDTTRTIGDVRFMGRKIEGIAPKDLRGIVDEAKAKLGSGVVAIVGVSDDGKAALVVGVTEDLTGRISAVDLVRAGAAVVGGKGGGGRPDMAQAGGPEGGKADEALGAIAAGLEKELAGA
ncbi:alanine--tRNA ligase [Lutibaculum baratangense]|uniref:Alanine--tRNA ligase n=1 Tax=Lutibaculum baratangense AMV1 TaxID=631454 RepID=V4RND4_9HYPH|nr:alanine--tRNA ligase [Lutibaculum baratangense]ESR26794.1 Alanyl-tRNA synthetase [Lutibaculum baratangense AMV1]